jgi:type IV fimbrial biogenesis protein FimT
MTITNAASSLGRRHSAGLTVIELTVVMVVVGVIIAVAIPSMRGMMARQRVQSVQADLLTDLQLARSELTKRSGSSVSDSTRVAVTFGGNASISCYTVHAVVAGITCDCTRALGTACSPVPMGSPSPEIKTTQLTRAVGVSLAASSPSGSKVEFTPPNGMVTPTDMVIDVQDALSGHLRTSISGLGVPVVCSPDGSIRGVPAC